MENKPLKYDLIVNPKVKLPFSISLGSSRSTREPNHIRSNWSQVFDQETLLRLREVELSYPYFQRVRRHQVIKEKNPKMIEEMELW